MKIPPTPFRGYYALIAATAADSVAISVVLPTLPFIAVRMGSGAFGVGAIAAAAGIAALVGQPLWGFLADRYGTRRILMIAPLVSASGQVIFAFSTSLPVLLFSRIIAGFGSAVVLLVQTHISKVAPKAERTALLGRVTAAQGVGSIIGPALGGLLISSGVRAVGLAAAAGPVTAVVLIATLVPATHAIAATTASATPGAKKPRRLASAMLALRTPNLRPLGVGILVGWFAFMGYSAILPVALLHRLDIASNVYGYVVSISGVVALVVRGILLGPLVRRFGETRLMAMGALLIAASMLLAVTIPNVWFTPLLPLTWALGASLLFPCLVGEFSKAAPPDAVGLVLGAGAMLSGTGIVLGPLALGALEEYVPASVAFLVGAALLIGVAVLVGRPRTALTAPEPAAVDPATADLHEADPHDAGLRDAAPQDADLQDAGRHADQKTASTNPTGSR